MMELKLQISLNPYSTGRYSVSRLRLASSAKKRCLNPYSTGRYSVRVKEVVRNLLESGVLILILLEDTL